MLDDPSSQITAHVANRFSLTGAMEPKDVDLIQRCVESLIDDKRRGQNVALDIIKGPEAHVGLGRRTSLILGCLVATSQLLEGRVDKARVQAACGRGGASGIGVNGFFSGGFIVDGGHRGVHDLLPSSFQTKFKIPPVIAHFQLPSSWQLALFDVESFRLSGRREREFFESVLPISKAEIYEAISILTLGMLPALAEEDLPEFGKAYSTFSRLGMKRREIDAHGHRLINALDFLSTKVPCAGMSSVGPTIFAIFQGTFPDLGDLPEYVSFRGFGRFNRNGFSVIDE